MKYRTLGSTGYSVSALGLGCMRLPTQRMRLQKIDVPAAVELIRSAVDRGINYIDTAWPYHLGESERVLGQALRDGYRDRVYLVTKLPLFLVSRQSDFDTYLDRQLDKLGTDHLDGYLFHAVNARGFRKIKELNLLEKMFEARHKGKLKHIGFSFHDVLPVFKEVVDFYTWDLVQIQYNYMDTSIQATTEGLSYAAEKGMAVVIMEPLKGGKLADPPADAVKVIRNAPVTRTPVDWALQYLWNLPEVSVVLSGMGSMKMLEENCGSAEHSGVGTLTRDELSTIDELTEIYRKDIVVPCTSCRYCLPCPAGVNIPKNFAILNNVVNEKSFIRRLSARYSYRKLASSPSQLNEEKSNGNASLCIECGQCLEKCPQAIHIPRELKKVDAVLRKRKKPPFRYPFSRPS